MTQPNPQYRYTPVRRVRTATAHRSSGAPHWLLPVSGALIAVIVAAIVLGAIFGNAGGRKNTGGSGAPSSSSSSSASPSNPTTQPTKSVPPPNPNQVTINKLTADFNNPSVSCVTLVKAAKRQVVSDVYVYDVEVRRAVQRGDPSMRQWSSATGVPLPGGTPAAKRQNLQLAICLDPWLGSLWAHAESTWKVGNVSVLAHNPWLRPFTDVSQVNDRAMAYEALFVPRKDLPEAMATAYVRANQRWQQMAEAIDTLISGLNPTEIKAIPAKYSWDCAGGCLVGQGLPEAELASQPDNLKALVLDVTQKGACAPLARFGANVYDKRPETFATPTCAVKTPGTPKSGCAGNTCGGGKGCTNCGSTPPGTPPSSHTHTCVCISTTSAAQSKPGAPVGPVKSTAGSGPPDNGKGNQPTSGIPTPPGGTDTRPGSDTNTPTPLPSLH